MQNKDLQNQDFEERIGQNEDEKNEKPKGVVLTSEQWRKLFEGVRNFLEANEENENFQQDNFKKPQWSKYDSLVKASSGNSQQQDLDLLPNLGSEHLESNKNSQILGNIQEDNLIFSNPGSNQNIDIIGIMPQQQSLFITQFQQSIIIDSNQQQLQQNIMNPDDFINDETANLMIEFLDSIEGGGNQQNGFQNIMCEQQELNNQKNDRSLDDGAGQE